MKDKIYLVWNDEDADCPYWDQFDSMEDAINSYGVQTEIYFAEPKLLGTFNLETKVVKMKTKKK